MTHTHPPAFSPWKRKTPHNNTSVSNFDGEEEKKKEKKGKRREEQADESEEAKQNTSKTTCGNALNARGAKKKGKNKVSNLFPQVRWEAGASRFHMPRIAQPTLAGPRAHLNKRKSVRWFLLLTVGSSHSHSQTHKHGQRHRHRSRRRSLSPHLSHSLPFTSLPPSPLPFSQLPVNEQKDNIPPRCGLLADRTWIGWRFLARSPRPPEAHNRAHKDT